MTQAIKSNRLQMTYNLISLGADLNKSNFEKKTPLELAIFNNRPKFVKALLDFGAKKDLVNNLGDSYLMQAIKINSIPIVKLLLDAGVPNQHVKNHKKITAIDLAYIYKRSILVRLLEKYGITSGFGNSNSE